MRKLTSATPVRRELQAAPTVVQGVSGPWARRVLQTRIHAPRAALEGGLRRLRCAAVAAAVEHEGRGDVERHELAADLREARVQHRTHDVRILPSAAHSAIALEAFDQLSKK